MSGRKAAWTLGLTLLLAATAAGAAKVWRDRRIERTVADGLADARRDREAGRVSSAAGQLAALERDYPGRDDVAIERAETELARDRPAIAVKLLEPIRDESPHATRAALLRGQAEIILGGLARAEDTLNKALRASAPGPDRIGLRDSLVRLLRAEGRIEEARRIFLEGQPDWADPIAFLRRLDRLDVEPFPIEGVRVYLDRAARAAPDDDRVWLGRARLLLREGRFDEARTWLEACRKRRPDDQAVWDAWLDWAEATQRFDVGASARIVLGAACAPFMESLARPSGTRYSGRGRGSRTAGPGRSRAGRTARPSCRDRPRGRRPHLAASTAQQAEINRRREALRAILTEARPRRAREGDFRAVRQARSDVRVSRLGRDRPTRADPHQPAPAAWTVPRRGPGPGYEPGQP
ncbi:MAG: tetratricopeptide repeat protein [Isosphaeraceae bacterium]